jgi:hypothetical protein
MPVPRIVAFQLTIMLAATIAVVTSAHAASDADREMVRVYADAMTNAIPTLANVQEEMEKDCSSMSRPSGVSSCIHGLDLGAAGVRTVRSRMSGLKVPDCLLGVIVAMRLSEAGIDRSFFPPPVDISFPRSGILRRQPLASRRGRQRSRHPLRRECWLGKSAG